MVKIEIKDKERVLRAFNELPKVMTREFATIMDALGVQGASLVEDTIRSGIGMWKSPIDTGAMWQGIGHSRRGLVTTIKTSSRTPYAVYVHEGTSKMRARPFMEITAENEAKNIEDFVNKRLEEVLNKIFK
jgi:HK97 gp10 family phage protein